MKCGRKECTIAHAFGKFGQFISCRAPLLYWNTVMSDYSFIIINQLWEGQLYEVGEEVGSVGYLGNS